MSHFAEINSDGLVTRVIVISQENIETGKWGNPETWVQTSYNTYGGKHYGQDGEEDSGVALRYNYAGRGYTYDTVRDAFIEPQPFPSWTLSEETCQWEAPVSRPDDDNLYGWDEDAGNWVEMTE